MIVRSCWLAFPSIGAALLVACATPSPTSAIELIEPQGGAGGETETGGTTSVVGGEGGEAGEGGAAGKGAQGGAGQGGKGGAAQGGKAGAAQGGKGGAVQGGAGQTSQGGKAGTAQGGQAGSAPGGKGGAPSGGQGGQAGGAGTGAGAGGAPIKKEACCSTHASPGCATASVEACVCDQDATCCTASWNALCVAKITQLGCGSCGTGGASGSSGQAGSAGQPVTDTTVYGGTCCQEQNFPSCSSAEVFACVSKEDSFCKNTKWDLECVGEVESLDCGVCGNKDTTCSQAGDRCYDCCIGAHLKGYNAWDDDFIGCACDAGCTTECKGGCTKGEPWSDACIACIQQKQGSGSCKSNCTKQADCAPFIACAVKCP